MPVRLLAAGVLALEAIGLLVLLGWQVVALVGGDASSLASSLALIVLSALGVLAIAAFAIATARDLSAGRSGGIVVQVLIAAVALGALTGEGADAALAAGLAAPALLGGILLVMAARRSDRRGRRDGDRADGGV